MMVFLGFLVLPAALLALSAMIFHARTVAVEESYPPLGEMALVDGVRLHFVDHVPPGWRDGDPSLVFVHGASANLRDPHMVFHHVLKDRYRMVFVDRPGHGYSERGPEDAHRPARQAALILELLRVRGIEKAIAVGHSWGGSVVAQMALLAPDRVAGLAFVAPATHPWPGGVNWYYEVASLPIIGDIFTHAVVPPVAQFIAPAAINNVFLPETPPTDYAERLGLPLLLRPQTFRANARDVALLKPEVTRAAPTYVGIEQPTAIVTGDRDTVVLNEIHAAGLLRDLPNAWRIDLEGAGHMPHHTRTADVITQLDALVEKIWGPTAAHASRPAIGRD